MVRVWVVLGCLGVGLGTVAGLASAQVAPVASLAEARGLAGKGKLAEALAELDSLAKQVPEEPGVERLRGVILYQTDRLAEAEGAFAKAVAQDAEDRQSRTMRGVTLYRLGRPGEAIPLLEGAERPATPEAGFADLTTNTTNTTPATPTAQRRDVGRPDSLPDAGKTAEISANVEPSYVLGLCYTDAKRYDDARRAFAAQFGFGADSAEAYLVSARLFLRREYADEAAVFAGKALELNPGLPLAHQLLGEIALARADLPAAVRELEAERKLNPLDGPLYDRLGDAYLRNGQLGAAREALNRAVLLEPNATGPYILLGETLVKMGEPIAALHYLRRAETMDPGNYVTHHALGDAYRATGQMEEANRELKLAVAIQHRNDPK